MKGRIPVKVTVGSSDTFGPKYYGDTLDLLNDARQKINEFGHREFRVNAPYIAVALLALHRLGEVEVELWHGPSKTKIDVDINGEFIQPWPDEFFELSFYCRFSKAKELGGEACSGTHGKRG